MTLSKENTDNLDIEIRKLPTRNLLELSQILELGDGWKELMAIVPKDDNPVKLKYNIEHMRMIEDAADKQKRTCSEIFLEEWGTSGWKRPTLSFLVQLLKETQLFRAAEYVTVNLLKGQPLVRLNEIPSTLLELPDINNLYLPTAPPLSSQTVTEQTYTENTITDKTLTEKRYSDHTSVYQDATRTCLESKSQEEANGIKLFKYEAFFNGTNGFREENKLGEGGFGSVYLCRLPNQTPIAVKRLHTDGAIPSELQFRNELLTVTQFFHPNLLPLVGYSSNGPELCLAYYYMVNGSLQDRLELKGETQVLDWLQRYNIACGAAEGLCHLHTFSAKPLVHRDVKSANILLDEHFQAKVGDFGLTKPGSNAQNTKTVAKTTTVLGTSAYMAPEAFRGDVSVKMDVFSFGVVLLELVTGLPPYDEDREGCDLASHVDDVDSFDALVDMKPNQVNMHLPNGMYEIAKKCLQEKKKRPNMLETLVSLKQIKST